MHAHVVTVDFTDADAAIKNLEELVPNVKASPGFVAGYWVRLDDATGPPSPCSRPRTRPAPRHRRSAAAWAASRSRGVQIGEVIGSA